MRRQSKNFEMKSEFFFQTCLSLFVFCLGNLQPVAEPHWSKKKAVDRQLKRPVSPRVGWPTWVHVNPFVKPSPGCVHQKPNTAAGNVLSRTIRRVPMSPRHGHKLIRVSEFPVLDVPPKTFGGQVSPWGRPRSILAERRRNPHRKSALRGRSRWAAFASAAKFHRKMLTAA